MKNKLTRIFFGSAAFALLATQAAAEGKISGITTKTVNDGLEVQINGSDLSAPKITRVMGGRSFMLEFDASLSSDPQWIRVEQDGVHYVQSVWSQSNPARIRIHLRVDPDTHIDVTPDAGGFLVKAAHPTVEHKPVTANLGSRGSITMYHEPDHLATKPTAPVPAPQVETSAAHQRTVSLDFVNTDIVQILKALALEAGVNIVTSPDVKGSLTVSLGSVSIKQALDLVTTMDGLKYGKIGSTYVVTTAENYPHILANLSNKNSDMAVARVVPIYSGEGTNIKDALRTLSNDVEILLPSDKPLSQQMVNQEAQAINGAHLADLTAKGGQPGAAGAAGGGDQGGGSNASGSGKVVDNYLILVGPAARLDTVEEEVKRVDQGLCHAEGINYPLSDSMVHEIYHPQGTNAGMLLGSLIMTDGSSAAASTNKAVYNYSFGTVAGYSSVRAFATPEGSTSEQTIVLTGRETEVDRLMEDLKSLDSLNQSDDNFVVYGVKYIDPRALREDLVAKFPGLSVNVPPASVLGTSTYTQGSELAQGQEKASQAMGANAGANSQGGSANQSAGAGGAGTGNQADSGQTAGLTAPFAADEQYGVPMKLVLHGAPELINEAEAYLNAVDVQPKQVALELRVMELSKEDALNLGLNWSLLTGGTVQAIGMNQGGPAQPTPGALPDLGQPGAAANLHFPGGGLLSVTAQLDQLADSNKMIARPNILALDGRESEMFVGDDIKYIQQIQSTQNGITITTGDVNVGVKLAVLPRIGAGNDISMELRPEVSTLLSFTPVPGGGEIPQTGLRIAQSTMVMHDGDTIAIGGLIQDSDVKKEDGIPILKDIPILNLLFGRTHNDHVRTEVVFFLTAHVVDNNSIHNAANPWRNEPMMDLSKKHDHHHK